ncbi:conserved hypothetical protein [Mesorhizobium plurifarium]|uniref:Uncharacterized protein n=1 Tax=Mesorhizobium plurifarium TaxID=69974 RepID=A0A090EFE9_MESPL|nr:conserved hypothetical protein [Mesorhizobium plurifarium]
MTDGTIVRHPHRGGKGGRGYLPAVDHPAIIEGRTVYTSTVKDPAAAGGILKSGHHNPKIGKVVTKGRWKGFPIFMLTLEERKTCPRSCGSWRSCYGNNVHLGERWQHGPELEHFLVHEVVALQNRYPSGFAVRLHILGDFYSVDYVLTWRALMETCPALHVFGFTARIDPEEPITRAVAKLRRDFPTRWWMRFSGALMEKMASEVVELPEQATPGFIVCPQQTGRTLACATCGLCWSSNKSIAFLRH